MDSPEKRFWSYVERNGRCWEWTGYQNKHGYGVVGLRGRKLAHRAAWEIVNGPIDPPETCVLHRCDNRKCVRPSHLFLGTRGDNNRDTLAKGRKLPGNPKLTPEQVAAIRSSSGTHRDLADKFGVSRPTVSYIKSGKTWSHIPCFM